MVKANVSYGPSVRLCKAPNLRIADIGAPRSICQCGLCSIGSAFGVVVQNRFGTVVW